jgi:sugar lactone lactonase YvrE
LAVDGAGNVYFADSGNDAILIWMADQDTVSLRNLDVLDFPQVVAVDSAGNIYFADGNDSAIYELTVSGNSFGPGSRGFSSPAGLAVDGAGNVFIADTFNNAIKVWMAANRNVITLVSNGLSDPYGVAVDIAGNVYIADTGNNAIKVWAAASSNVTTLVPGLNAPEGVAVDGAGNVYIADSDNATVKEWNAATSTVAALASSGSSYPSGVAVDGTGNVYFAQAGDNAIKELPYAFVDTTPKLEGPAAGNDTLPMVLPETENLVGPFAPTTDQSWLTITGVANGIVSFSFTANTGPNRTANITLLGQKIPVTQGMIGPLVILPNLQILGNGVVRFTFSNTLSSSFTVLSTTNLSLPWSNWTVVGTATNTAPGQFQFTSQPTTNDVQRFYGVRSP